jgi:F-type H+-transporting ATPase subunit b
MDKMKKLLFILSCVSPLVLFANDTGVETDILQRTVNFFIFIAILYYLLADKARAFFSDRTSSIQAELDKVQQVLKESEAKVEGAKAELEDAKKIALDIVETANADTLSIKKAIEESVDNEIEYLLKSFDEKIKIETKKVKKEVVSEILEQLLSTDNITISQNELANIVLKKVA